MRVHLLLTGLAASACLAVGVASCSDSNGQYGNLLADPAQPQRSEKLPNRIDDDEPTTLVAVKDVPEPSDDCDEANETKDVIPFHVETGPDKTSEVYGYHKCSGPDKSRYNIYVHYAEGPNKTKQEFVIYRHVTEGADRTSYVPRKAGE